MARGGLDGCKFEWGIENESSHILFHRDLF